MAYFSVIIPLYNKQRFVSQTIESVLAQTFRDFEVLIVDDCSTDNSLNVVRKFDDNRIQIISHGTNRGLSAARNTGIKNAASEIVTFVDADDLWKTDFLQNIVHLINEFPEAGLFATAYEEMYANGRQLAIRSAIAIPFQQMGLVRDFFAAASKQPILWYGSAAVRKAVFEKCGDFDERITLGEDVDFNIRANIHFKLAYYNTIGASYRIESENQITRSNISRKTVTDFDKYEVDGKNNPTLKKFLDVNRYTLAIAYKLAGDKIGFSKMISGIDMRNLSRMQQILLKLPAIAVKFVRHTKGFLLRRGIRVTSFDTIS